MTDLINIFPIASATAEILQIETTSKTFERLKFRIITDVKILQLNFQRVVLAKKKYQRSALAQLIHSAKDIC